MARTTLHGIAVSAGISIGKVFFTWHSNSVNLPRVQIAETAQDAEIVRLQNAVARVKTTLQEARDRVPADLKEHAAIINSHLVIATDPKLFKSTCACIHEKSITAEWALEQSVEAVISAFARIDDEYIRERMQDVRLVSNRILQELLGDSHRPEQREMQERMVLMAYDISPADVIDLPLPKIMSLVTQEGGKTSHTGILARSLQIPAIVGVEGLTEQVEDGDFVIIDALQGLVIVDPNEAELEKYTNYKYQFEAYQKTLQQECALPAETLDGFRLEVNANVEMPSEAPQVLQHGGEGVGLYRTEYSYLNSQNSTPTEEELFAEYNAIAESLAPKKVVLRTLDVGADKMTRAQSNLHEPNPALGLRAIRYCLKHTDVFKTQLRAILRASVHDNVTLMFPMISGVQELRDAKALLQEVREELTREGIPFNRELPVGIMIELPSAVLLADELAAEVDFFSIGTNDLIQYSLGIDRCNSHVAHLYQPLHPAIVRSVKFVVDAAHRVGIEVSICGEVASDPYCIPLLLGMQIDSISLSPQAIPGIKHIIRSTDIEDCKRLLHSAIRMKTVQDINAIVRKNVFQRMPEELAFFSSTIEHDI